MKWQPTIRYRGRAGYSVHVVQVVLGVGILQVVIVGVAGHAAVEPDGGIVTRVAIDSHVALVVVVVLIVLIVAAVVAQLTGSLQARFLIEALVVDAAERGFLVRCGRPDPERCWVGGLVGVVLGSGRCLVLEIQRICGLKSAARSRMQASGHTSSDDLRARHARSYPLRLG